MERLRATIAEMLPDNSLGEEYFSLLSLKNNESWKYKKMVNVSAWDGGRKKVMAMILQRVKKPHFPPTFLQLSTTQSDSLRHF